MQTKNKDLFDETQTLKKTNRELRHKLSELKETIEEIKNANKEFSSHNGSKSKELYPEISIDKTYRILIDKMNEGAVIANSEGVILYCNVCFGEMIGNSIQKIIGRQLSDFVEDSQKERIGLLFSKERTRSSKVEIDLLDKNNKLVHALMSVNPLQFKENKVISILFTDLSILQEIQMKMNQKSAQLDDKNQELENVYKEVLQQVKEMKERNEELDLAKLNIKELVELNKHKEMVLATLSHDLRSPLAGIIVLTEHLQARFEKMDSGKIRDSLDLLHKASTDELKMLDDLVDWARVKFASESFAPSKIRLSDQVNKVFETLSDIVATKEISLINEVIDKIYVYADANMLLSILQNIISNSIEHTLKCGEITVSAKDDEDKIIIEIRDNGVGMSQGVLENLFTPQMEALTVDRPDKKGAGIGLLLVQSFIEKNGGEIWVESEEGKGSSFFFTLPGDKPMENL